ncbi:MAG TPA: tail fiber domain-containing protein [Longimicrobium sp.]|nr:tail fiber domain-containing protein [Longimicrobium sp.]
MLNRARTTALAVAGALTLLCGAAEAHAQSDILLQLRSGSPAGDRFRVDSAGGVVAIGELGIGIIPASGAGYRMMWYPYKAAFRAGGTDDGGAGNYWDDANVGFYSWAGGNLTKATVFASFAFGDQVEVTGVDAAGFGASNTVGGTAAFSAGSGNHVCGFASVAIGFTNTTGSAPGGVCAAGNGQGSVAIGYRVTADADYAVALGHRASANGHDGAFVAADQSTTDSLEASANNQFSTRYAGGYRLYTNATTTAGVQVAAGGGSWSSISDRNRKSDFLDVNGEDLLARLRNVPVTTWRYRAEADRSTFHIGPMAQDWQAAFGFSRDGTTINMGDIDGVNLAAVKALEQRTTSQAARIQTLEAQVAELQRTVQALVAAQQPKP